MEYSNSQPNLLDCMYFRGLVRDRASLVWLFTLDRQRFIDNNRLRI